jgi:hypothetical protein
MRNRVHDNPPPEEQSVQLFFAYLRAVLLSQIKREPEFLVRHFFVSFWAVEKLTILLADRHVLTLQRSRPLLTRINTLRDPQSYKKEVAVPVHRPWVNLVGSLRGGPWVRLSANNRSMNRSMGLTPSAKTEKVTERLAQYATRPRPNGIWLQVASMSWRAPRLVLSAKYSARSSKASREGLSRELACPAPRNEGGVLSTN